MDEVYQLFSTFRLFNASCVTDDMCHIPDLKEYMNHVAINFGLSGLLTRRSPREMIEGYLDPLIETLNETPVYMGGDRTTSPLLSLAKPPTLPNNNKVALFTGE